MSVLLHPYIFSRQGVERSSPGSDRGWGNLTEAELGAVWLDGILKKKKSDHGMFEDAWKQRLRVTLCKSGPIILCEEGRETSWMSQNTGLEKRCVVCHSV